MRIALKPIFSIISFLSICFTSFKVSNDNQGKLYMPYREAQLSEKQAAAHLLSRFTFGARPGDIAEVVKVGLSNWFLNQLEANIPEDTLNLKLNEYPDLKLSNSDIAAIYVNGGLLKKRLIDENIINKDSLKVLDKPSYRAIVKDYLAKNGLKQEKDLEKQQMSQKVLRAIFSKNQLKEVLTNFWFNHFNVAYNKPDCSLYITAYERDAIRPFVLGKFQDLLLSTAQSPAMLYYLDNFSSVFIDTSMTNRGVAKRNMILNPKPVKRPKKMRGLNENYAREVMELHTLGVDGGYTQSDVTQAARILTGWGVYPLKEKGPNMFYKNLVDKFGTDEMERRGFVRKGDFLFTMNQHDSGEKMVLGHRFRSGGGYQEGVELLNLLAHNNSTAHFISRKLAIRFVGDNPSQNLVDKMAKTFSASDGNIREVLLTMVSTPEFWSPAVLRQKIKSPFEYAISAVRCLASEVSNTRGITNWVNKMGEQTYHYLAPTGFPDQGTYWINSGSLLNRMNFGLSLASGKVDGINTDLLSLNQHHEPESNEAALRTYSSLMLPERDLKETITRLTPLLNQPDLSQKIQDAPSSTENSIDTIQNDSDQKPTRIPHKNATSLAQVVGIVIGSPEFQRR